MTTTTTAKTKACTRCGTKRPLTAFPFRSDARRRRSVCQRCINEAPAKSPAQPQPKPSRAPDLPRPDWGWQDAAACRGEDLVLFFGVDGERLEARLVRETHARGVCGGCPVRNACLDSAIATKAFGVWGGMNDDERRAERRRRMRRVNAA